MRDRRDLRMPRITGKPGIRRIVKEQEQMAKADPQMVGDKGIQHGSSVAERGDDGCPVARHQTCVRIVLFGSCGGTTGASLLGKTPGREGILPVMSRVAFTKSRLACWLLVML